MARGQLQEWLDRLARLGGVVSALEAIVADRDRVVLRHAAGFRVGGERLAASTGARFDAASLSKPWMATLALALDRAAIRSLDAPLPAAACEVEGAPTTSADLLRHRAGMPAWSPLAVGLGRRLSDRSELQRFLLGLRRESAGAGALYSDLGYLLWGLLAEESCDRSLDDLLDRHVCAPLGVAALGARAAAGEVPNAVECRLDNGREVELAAAQGVALGRQLSFRLGVAQDANVRALREAGLAPAHAGLFVTADEMLALGREWLAPGRLLAPDQVAVALAGDGGYALGWARQADDGSSGPALPPTAFGHTGFTGGSLWIDPERHRIYLLMAHRLSSSIDFNPFRREFHRLAAAVES